MSLDSKETLKLTDLLRWSVENSSSGSQTSSTEAAAITLPSISSQQPLPSENSSIERSQPSHTQPIDPKWIDIVLGQDDVKKMKDARDVLLRMDASQQDLEIALDDILFLVESIDNANDLHTIGGLVPVINLLKSELPTVRVGAAWVLQTAALNNSKVQKQILENRGLPLLLNLLRTDANAEARSKALSAISSLLGHNPEGVEIFDRLRGLEVLNDCLRDGNAGDLILHRKIAFMLRQMTVSEAGNYIAPRLLEAGLVSSLVECVAMPDLDLREKALDCLDALLQNEICNKEVLKQLKASSKLKDGLELIKSEIEEQPEKKEELSDLAELTNRVLSLIA